MKVNVIIKGGRRWDYGLRQRHNPSLAGTMGAGGGKKNSFTRKAEGGQLGRLQREAKRTETSKSYMGEGKKPQEPLTSGAIGRFCSSEAQRAY